MSQADPHRDDRPPGSLGHARNSHGHDEFAYRGGNFGLKIPVHAVAVIPQRLVGQSRSAQLLSPASRAASAVAK